RHTREAGRAGPHRHCGRAWREGNGAAAAGRPGAGAHVFGAASHGSGATPLPLPGARTHLAMRLFVALHLPGDVRSAMVELIARLKPTCRAAKWARPDGMHVTLKFIGSAVADGDSAGLAAVRGALATVKSGEPVEIRYRGTGFF